MIVFDLELPDTITTVVVVFAMVIDFVQPLVAGSLAKDVQIPTALM